MTPTELYEYERAPEGVLRQRVALYLRQSEGPAFHLSLDRDDLAQAKRLAAAALHDIAGLQQRAVREWVNEEITTARRVQLMSGSEPGPGDTTVIGRRIREGRRLWVQLGAWPWWAITDALGPDALSGGMPKRWWELRRVEQTYAMWTCLRADGSRAELPATDL